MVLHGQSSGCVIPKINQTMKLIFHVYQFLVILYTPVHYSPPPPQKKSISCLPNFKPPSYHLKSMFWPPTIAIADCGGQLGVWGMCFSGRPKMQPCDPSSAFFGFMGVTSAFLFGGVGGGWRSNYHPWFRWRLNDRYLPFKWEIVFFGDFFMKTLVGSFCVFGIFASLHAEKCIRTKPFDFVWCCGMECMIILI